MGKQDRIAVLVIGVLIIVMLATRLLFALNAPNMADDDSYYHLRQLQHMTQTSEPFSFDSLSFGGHEVTIEPIWYLLFPLAQIFGEIGAINIAINATAIMLIAIVYVFTLAIIKNQTAAVLSAASIAINPALISLTINQMNTALLGATLSIISLYSFYNAVSQKKDKGIVSPYIVAFVCYAFAIIITPTAAIVLLGFVLFFMLSKSEGIAIPKIYTQFWLLLLMLSLWILLLLYADALQTHGLGTLNGNTPFNFRSDSLLDSDLVNIVNLIGIVPLLAASYYLFGAFKEKKQRITLLLATTGLSVLLLSALTIISIEITILYLCIIASILTGCGYQNLNKYISKTKLSKHKNTILTTIVILGLASLAWPAFSVASQETIPIDAQKQSLIDAIAKTEPNALVIAPPEDAQKIMYYATRKTFIDRNYLYVQDVEAKYKAYQTILSTPFVTDLLSNVEVVTPIRANATYIVSRNTLPTQESACVSRSYTNPSYILAKVECVLR